MILHFIESRTGHPWFSAVDLSSLQPAARRRWPRGQKGEAGGDDEDGQQAQAV